jgi:CheY-like chemotaxis protein
MSTKPLDLEHDTKASSNIGEEIRIELEKRGLRAPSTHKLVDEIKRMKEEIATSKEVDDQVDRPEQEDANLITHPTITADGKGVLVPPESRPRSPDEIVTGMLAEDEERVEAIEQELSVQTDEYRPSSTGNLLADATHELRIPLQAITGFLELLHSDKVSNAQEAKHFLSIAYSESQYLSNRVTDLEVAALIDAGIFRVKSDPVLVNQLVKSCVQSHTAQAGNKQILLKEDRLEDLPTIFGDETHIRHALSNLIEWAVGSTNQPSEIVIRAGVERDTLWIGVESRPLPEIEVPEPIMPLHQTSYEEIANRGMPIFIAEHIIEAHGGELIMRETLDDELFFRIDLPLSMEKTTKGTILITEDDPHTGLLLEFALEQEGFTPIRATNGSDALHVLEETDVDLIILDAILPGIDGFELCQRIRETPRLDAIPIIMASAKAQEENRAKAVSLGASEYFQKPLSLSTLIPAVERLIDESHRTVKPPSSINIQKIE